MRLFPLLPLLLLTACAPARTPPASTANPTCADAPGTSTLPGVCITFAASGGSWTLGEAAAGIEIPYTLHIERALDAVVALPQDAGGCGQPDDHGLILFERLGSGDTEYCVCDEGLCGGLDETPQPLAPGTWERAFRWDGQVWFGPSDFGNQPGPAFPPGTYELVVSATGRYDAQPFEVRAPFAVELTE